MFGKLFTSVARFDERNPKALGLLFVLALIGHALAHPGRWPESVLLGVGGLAVGFAIGYLDPR